MFALLLLACSPFPGMTDRWSETYTACQPDPWDRVYNFADAPLTALSEDCAALIDADFGYPETFVNPDAQVAMREVAFNLLGRELGQVSALRETEYVRAPFIEMMQTAAAELGTDALRQVVYNFAAWSIEGTRERETLPFTFNYVQETHTMAIRLSWSWEAEDGYGLLPLWVTSVFHEATHRPYPGHITCDNGGTGCDADWAGANGFQAAYAALAAEHCAEEVDAFACSDFENWAMIAGSMVMAE